MIRLLADLFRGGPPDAIEEYLEHGVARCMAFNRRGTLLATGCASGDVVLWDFETRGVAKELKGGHAGEVTALSWSRDGRRLASACDGLLLVWDVLAGTTLTRVKLPAAPMSVQLHPHRPGLALVCLAGECAQVVELENGALRALPNGTPPGEEPAPVPARKPTAALAPPRGGSVAVLERWGCGRDAFVGGADGTLARVALQDGAARACLRLCSPGIAVRALSLGPGGALLAVCADRALRLVDTAGGGLSPQREFRDAVARCGWHAAGMSCDGALLAGYARGGAGEHAVHVWRAGGELVHVLEAPPDAGAPAQLQWHPRHPSLLASLGSGRVQLWARTAAENWSAFAPDFRELEENEEYVEREDEFDVQPGGGAAQGVAQVQTAGAGAGAGQAQQPLDVLTLTPSAESESDGDGDGDGEGVLHHLPLQPLREEAPSAPSTQTLEEEEAAKSAAAKKQRVR